MPNGVPLVSDYEVLLGFAEPFIIDGMPRDYRMARRWRLSVKQVYAIWNKKRFSRLIDYGVTMRSGWLTPEGEAALRAHLQPPASPSA